MMKKSLMNSALAVGLVSVASISQACTVGAWLGGNTGDVAAGGPLEATALTRYSGQCAMQASSGNVQDYSPQDEARMITRFYFLPSGSGTATIYQAFSDQPAAAAAGAEVYSISYDGSSGNITVDASAVGGGSVQIAGQTGWNSVEVDWNSGGQMNVWVNEDAASVATPTGTAAAGTGTISASRLGVTPTAGAVTAVFDDFESRRTTAVGRLLLGDAQNDGDVDVFDVITLVGELVNPANLVPGPADFQEDGDFDVFDAISIVNFLVNG